MFRFLLDLINPSNLFPRSSFQGGNRLTFGIWLLIVFTVFSGAIRKWGVSSGAVGNLIFLVQLILPILFYFLISKNALPKLAKPPKLWGIFLVYLVLIALNPMNGTIFHGIFGLLLHTGLWFIWLAYLEKGNWIELEKFIPLLVLILIFEFFLASAQYALPGNHFLNQYVGGNDADAFAGDAVRVTGTFSYLGGFQALIPLIACLAWFLMVRQYSGIFVFLVLGMGLLMAFMSGSRTAVGYFILYVAIAFFTTEYSSSGLIKLTFQSILVIGLLVTFFPSFQSIAGRTYDNFIIRAENSDNVNNRITGTFEEILFFRGKYPIFGVGLGATYQGANALFGESRFVKEYGGYESEPARIVLEGGFVLLLLRTLLFLFFIRATRYLPLMAKVFFFIVFLNSMLTFNTYQGIFYVLGIILVDRGYYIKYNS